MRAMYRRTAGALLAIAMAVLLLVGLGGLLNVGVQPLPIQAQPAWSNFTNVRVGSYLATAPKTTRTVTDNGTLNALGTFQPVTAASAVGTSGANITVKPAGTILVLLNVGSNTITFTETGTLVSAGNIALGANDSATLLSNGTNWYQIAASNN